MIVADNGDDTTQIVYASGNPAGTLSQVPLALAHPTLDVQPTGASIYADDSCVFIGASAWGNTTPRGDALGWTFLLLP